MIFFVNAQGDAMQVTPSSVYQGSNNASEIVLIAPFAQSATVTAFFTLPNGIDTERYNLVPVYSLADPPVSFGGGLGVWRMVLDRVITQYSGIETVSFMIDLGEEEPTTASVSFNITKGYKSLGSAPVPSKQTYNEIANSIRDIGNQIADLQSEIDASETIKRITFDEETSELTFVVNAIKTEENPDGEKVYTFSLSYLRDGYVKDASFEDDTLTITVYETDEEGNPSEKAYAFDLSPLRDDAISNLYFSGSTAKLDLDTPKGRFSVNLGALRNGNLIAAELDDNSNLVLTVSGAEKDSTKTITTNLSRLVGGIESVSFNDDTNILTLTYKTENGLQSANIEFDKLLDDLNIENGSGVNSIKQRNQATETKPNVASGKLSATFGYRGESAGDYSASFGSYSKAGDIGTFAGNAGQVSFDTPATFAGESATYDNTAPNAYFAAAFNTGRSFARVGFAIGERGTVVHEGGFAQGYETITGKKYQAVLGKHNKQDGEALLVVGCGDASSARENCFSAGKSESGKYIKIGNTTLKERDLIDLLSVPGNISAALDEIIGIQEALIGAPEYDGSVTIVTN